MGRKSPNPAADMRFYRGAGANSHLRRRARRVSETFAHTRACPGKTAAHSRDASIPAVYRLAESARSDDGAVTSVTSAEMPAPITTPMIIMTAVTAPTKHLRAATATITNEKLASESSTHSRARELHPADALARTH
jgi:hypothetical protein